MKNFALLVILFFTLSTQAGEITVFGKCTKKVKPDRASLAFNSEALMPTGVEAQKKVNAIYEDVRAAIKKLNLKDQEIQTSNLSVYEDVVWENQKSRSKGFKATASIELSSSEIERIGEAIPVALKAGAKSFGSLYFYLSDSLQEKSYNECLGEATSNAQMKAQKLLSAQNKKITDLVELIEGTHEPAPRQMRMMEAEGQAFASDKRSSAPTLETKDLTINVTVTARFKF